MNPLSKLRSFDSPKLLYVFFRVNEVLICFFRAPRTLKTARKGQVQWSEPLLRYSLVFKIDPEITVNVFFCHFESSF